MTRAKAQQGPKPRRVLCPIAHQSPLDLEACGRNQVALVSGVGGAGLRCRGQRCRLFCVTEAGGRVVDATWELAQAERARVNGTDPEDVRQARRNWAGKDPRRPATEPRPPEPGARDFAAVCAGLAACQAELSRVARAAAEAGAQVKALARRLEALEGKRGGGR